MKSSCHANVYGHQVTRTATAIPDGGNTDLSWQPTNFFRVSNDVTCDTASPWQRDVNEARACGLICCFRRRSIRSSSSIRLRCTCLRAAETSSSDVTRTTITWRCKLITNALLLLLHPALRSATPHSNDVIPHQSLWSLHACDNTACTIRDLRPTALYICLWSSWHEL